VDLYFRSYPLASNYQRPVTPPISFSARDPAGPIKFCVSLPIYRPSEQAQLGAYRFFGPRVRAEFPDCIQGRESAKRLAQGIRLRLGYLRAGSRLNQFAGNL
jgi:hypothetical protein